jgi:hypothetical protein
MPTAVATMLRGRVVFSVSIGPPLTVFASRVSVGVSRGAW